ncbi:hypothetical protein QBC37DRAFT_443694 [Rhypophila decipiens]|uniref:AAA+ ATPase domain-containing protein n=1 Tax=Rhypophila decipiens TaxID=261697 RepID=A0AAN6XXN0_9PEZI|nr:hypothetical protein QBC37DRAFT_443694 [Rhypophila decipiens]
MSQIEMQPSGAIPIAPVDKSGISLRQDTDIGSSQMTLVDGTSQSVEAVLLPRNPAPEDESPVSNLAPEEGPHLPETVQEAKITRIPAEEWRRVKNGLKIDRAQSVLLVSSKSSFKTDLRKRRKLSTAQKLGTGDNKTTGADQATNRSAQLDVPYRLAINSTYLLEALGHWIGPELSETRNVLVRPFKYLVFYEQEIRQFCSDLELVYDQAEEEAAAEGKVGDEMPTGDPASGQDTKRDAADRAKRERDEFRCVIEFMDRDMADIFDIKRQITDKTLTEIAFEHLWQLFRPKDIVYLFKPPEDASRCQAYQILHVAGGRVCFDTDRCRNIVRSSDHEITSFLIDCFHIDSDGRRVGPRPKGLVVQRYNGTRPLKLLPMYPAFLHPNHQQIQEMMLARGALFAELAMGSHRRYDGPTFREANQTSKKLNNFVIDQAEVHGEVIVDQTKGVEHLGRHLYKWDLRLGGGIIFIPTEADARETFDPLPGKHDNGWVTDVVNDSKFELDRRAEFVQSTEILSFQNHGKQGFSNECLLLFPPRLYGYSLLDHKWFALDINHIADIPPRSTTTRFEDLVLPKGHGMLLRALMKIHVRVPPGSSAADDVTGPISLDAVADKGKGLIILLHGVPGVGKTSTAECIASELKRPLLPITCGDIGTTAHEAENTLESFCTLAHAWRCVLLLDEADVFLTKREKGDVVRNALVSVFLRVLEYYSGVIILTTNRVGEFDEAFRSRIHISLYYPKLGREPTTEIWEKNIARLKASDIDIDMDKIRRFIDKHWEMNKNMPSRRWNGRQIKNAFQTAIALARWDFYEGGGRSKDQNLKRPLLRASHFMRDEDSYGILANRDEARKDSNPGPVLFEPVAQEVSSSRPTGGRQTMRAGTGGFGSARGRASHGFQDWDASDDDEDDVEQLELKLKLAKLKKKKEKEKGVTRTEVVEDMSEDEDEAW